MRIRVDFDSPPAWERCYCVEITDGTAVHTFDSRGEPVEFSPKSGEPRLTVRQRYSPEPVGRSEAWLANQRPQATPGPVVPEEPRPPRGPGDSTSRISGATIAKQPAQYGSPEEEQKAKAAAEIRDAEAKRREELSRIRFEEARKSAAERADAEAASLPAKEST